MRIGRRVKMELALEVFDTINCTIVLSLAFLVPFYSQPYVISCLRIVLELSSIPYATNNLLEKHSLSKKIKQVW